MEEHTTNGQQQEQQAERDPRHLPPQKSWAEVIAESNRRCALYRRHADEQNRKIGSLTMQLDEARETIARQEERIAQLFLALGWDVDADLDQHEHETAKCEPPPF